MGGILLPSGTCPELEQGRLLQFYTPQLGINDVRLASMWELWATAPLPHHPKDFVRKVLWRKLTVHERVQKR